MYDTTLGWRFVNPRAGRDALPVLDGRDRRERRRALRHRPRGPGRVRARQSQQRAVAAIEAGRFADEIVPVDGRRSGRATPIVVDRDEHPRADTTLEALAKLRPGVHARGRHGHGRQRSGINDGAAAVLVVEAERARELGLKPLARVVSTAVAGVDPAIMGIGPVPATRKALDRAGLAVDGPRPVELNEAFAAPVARLHRELGLDPAKVNVNGGAIALGHPLG